MIELALTHDAEQYGRQVKRRQDARGLGDKFKVPGADKRWTGHAVEYALNQYFEERQWPHVWHGGLDTKPDFELCGMGVASKANTGPGPREDFVFVIPKPMISRLADVALFSMISPREAKIWIVGSIHSTKFRERAELRRKGEEGFVPGRPLFADCWGIKACDLDLPEDFFSLLEVLRVA